MNLDLWKVPKHLDTILKDSPKIVTRFPPEPSGYLHIGHAKAVFINYVIAKKYGGQMIMRYDDTNPLKESLEFEKAISDDLSRLEIVPDLVTHTSDYFDQIMNYAEFLILKGKAYVDDTPQDLVQDQRRKGIDSINRNACVDDNMKNWLLMKSGNVSNSFLRLKIDMNHINSACRDPAIFRSIDVGGKFQVYPTYDFACPIVDSLEGITHVFRSVEFADRDEQYQLIISELGIRQPLLFSYGKVKFKDVVLSKRKIKDLIDKGIVSDWFDPRLFTLRGLFNRGLCLDALRQFIAKIGFSKNTTNMTKDMLWSINKKTVDKIATRYTCISTNYSEFSVISMNGVTSMNIPKYVKNPSLGNRNLSCTDTILIDKSYSFDSNEEITLMNLGNAYVNSNHPIDVNSRSLLSNIVLNPSGDVKSTKQKVLWIDDKSVNVRIDTYSDSYQPCQTNYYLGESELLNIKKGDYVQFIKMNYYICTSVNIENRIVSFIELD